MSDRDVEFDIIAGDKASKPLERVGEAAEDAGDDLDKLKRKAKAAGRELDDTGDKANRTGDRLKKFGTNAQIAARTTAKLVGAVAAVGAASGPAALGIIAATKAVASFGASVAPAAAVLPGLVAGLLLVKATAKLAGPTVAKAFEPIGKELEGLGKRLGETATRHLPRLWTAFKRANLPTVSRNMMLIADAADRAALKVGNWVNSARGQRTVAMVSGHTAGLMQLLADRAADVAIALGRMIDRVGDEGFKRLPRIIDRVTDAVVRLIDGVSRGDVKQAFSDISNIGVKLKNTVAVVRDIGRWMGENTTAVTAFSDALAGVAVVAGIASGGWLIALGGAITLLVNHWKDLKKAASAAREWFERFRSENPAVQQVIDSLSVAVARVKAGFFDLVEMVRPHVMPMLAALKDAWTELAPLVAKLAPILGKLVGDQLRALGALIVVALKATTAYLQFVTKATRAFKLLAANAAVLREQIRLQFFRAALHVGEAVRTMLNFLGRMPGPAGAAARRAATAVSREMGKLRTSVAASERKVRDLKRQLAALRSKKITLTIATVYKNYGGESAAKGRYTAAGLGKRAAGGPVRSGVGYLMNERGPEIYVPAQDGRILSAAETKTVLSGGGGGGTHVHLHVPYGFVGSERDLAVAITRVLDTATGRGQLTTTTGRTRRRG